MAGQKSAKESEKDVGAYGIPAVGTRGTIEDIPLTGQAVPTAGMP